MQTFTHIIEDPLGLHARPAAMLVKTISGYQSTVPVKTPNGSTDARRLMALMRLGAKQGAALIFTVEGSDEASAAESLKTFLKENL